MLYCLIDGSQHLELNPNGGGQAIDLQRGSTGGILTKILSPQTIVNGKIIFHVGQKNRHIHNFIPAATRIFQNPSNILKHTPNVDFWQDMASGIVVKDGRVCGFVPSPS